ncbi:MAG TPA: lysophospholipid acyltransferase family protein [Lachnospiraceae bacterium]|nr:lysophospholipid acyltransferase family protein [Lachnospiraceae bacterium]
MKRIILMILRLFFTTPYYVFRIGKFARDKRPYDEAFSYIQRITKKVIKAGRVTIQSYGMENLPKEDGFIMFPNHQGLFDGLVFLDSCPRTFAYITKKEARNVILLKQVGDALGSIAIDREDIRQSMQVINQVTEEAKKGRNFLIFPEGTRSKQGNQLLNFKGGSFKSATRAKCPIVPCALIDSFKPFDESSIKRVTVQLIYLSPLYYEEYKEMKTHEIAAEVKKRIEDEIARRLEETPV